MAYFQEGRPAREPFLRAPASVVALIGVIAAAHVARVLAPAAVSERILNTYALHPAVYTAPTGISASWTDRVVPLFSHMLLHADLTHLAVNSVWLLAFGPIVARRFGALPFYVLFVISGLAGALAFVALDWGQNVGVIGASGAISGLMGAAIRMMRVREPYLNAATLPLMPLLSSQVVLFTAVWLLVNAATGLLGVGLTGSMQAIAWQDHMGGYFAGLLLAGPFEHLFGRLRRRTA